MILFPNAKLNLGLDILRRRADGYHDISTVMIPIGWRDVLEIVPAQEGKTTLTVTGRKVDCPPEKNLVMKAYRLLASEIDIPAVDIYLRKVIPDGAGMGGGSADAAFTLRGLNELFALGLNNEELARLAARLGADCPFFIHNRPMLCEGTGTDMRPIDVDLSGYKLLIVKSPVSVPTAAAYAGVTPAIPAESVADIIADSPNKWPGRLKNDFEATVFAEYPAIAEVKKHILDLGAVYAAMSGSGSAVFGLFEADKLSDHAAQLFPGCDVHIE